MPDPRPLGNKAKDILTNIESSLIVNQRELFQVVLDLLRDDREAAIGHLKTIAERNEAAARAVTLLRVNELDKAADLIEAELKK